MKKVLYIVIALGMINTFAGAGWLNLSDKTCDRYGKGTCHLGTAYTCGCRGSLTRAKKVCRQAGGRLPSYNELKRVAKSCGVSVTKFGSKTNRAFKDCVRRKGFLEEKYWTKDYTYRDSKEYFVGVHFGDAHKASMWYAGKNAYIRCIK